MPQIILIAAMAANRVIGSQNALPRSFPEDLQHFKKLTTGHPIIMWKNTYDSIGRPLPNRRNIVLSYDYLNIEWVEVFTSIEECLDELSEEEKIFIIGGASIYKQFVDQADIIELTEIHEDYEWDTYFPEFEDQFDEVHREEGDIFDFVTYERI